MHTSALTLRLTLCFLYPEKLDPTLGSLAAPITYVPLELEVKWYYQKGSNDLKGK
jgi:hypothetical protein